MCAVVDPVAYKNSAIGKWTAQLQADQKANTNGKWVEYDDMRSENHTVKARRWETSRKFGQVDGPAPQAAGSFNPDPSRAMRFAEREDIQSASFLSSRSPLRFL